MENGLIEKWLGSIGYGDGDGDGSGSGSGDGEGYGDGSGEGSGYGHGSGEGYGDGSGDGDGDGYGYGSGESSGDGDGDGDGSGSGSGYGDRYGSGDGYGYGYGKIAEYCGEPVFWVDGIQTVILQIFGNYAKGYTIGDDWLARPCYLAKGENKIAHGATLRQAQQALQAKIFEEMPIEERIAKFMEKFPAYDEKYNGRDFYEWHHILTGSCKFGRDEFIRNHMLSVDDTYTVKEFIEICKDYYGGDIIEQLRETYDAERG